MMAVSFADLDSSPNNARFSSNSFERDTTISSSKRRRGPGKQWMITQEFDSREDAAEFIIVENCWSVKSKNRTSDGVKVYYRCNKAKRGQCPVEIYMLYERTSERVLVFSCCQQHQHGQSSGTHTQRGLPEVTKAHVVDIINAGIQKPKAILKAIHERNARKLRSEPKIPIPPKMQLRNFVSAYVRQKNDASPSAFNLQRFTDWCLKPPVDANLALAAVRKVRVGLASSIEQTEPFYGHIGDGNDSPGSSSASSNDETHRWPEESNVAIREFHDEGTTCAALNVPPALETSFSSPAITKIECSDDEEESPELKDRCCPDPEPGDLSDNSGKRRFKIEDIDPSSESSSSSNSSSKLKIRPRRGPAKQWILTEEFESYEAAAKFIAMDGCWSTKSRHYTRDGVKVYYRCNRVLKTKGNPCPAEVCLLHERASEKVLAYASVHEHDHTETGQAQRGIPAHIKHVIRGLYTAGTRKPQAILWSLERLKLPLPTRSQLAAYIANSLKQKPTRPRQSRIFPKVSD